MSTAEHLSDHIVQDEINVHRWTSDTVLTTGVTQGWADPEDWHEIDFDTRPSCQGDGTYEFDNEGRPLNRHRTPDMPGDRGELGKHGSNYAAESLIVAIDPTGKRRILLVRRNDPGRTDEEQQWSLPGGMVDAADGHASQTAIREAREEAGLDLATTPCKILYQMPARDRRDTRNAWIETTGVLQMLYHTPQTKADGVEISATRWFDLPDTLEELEAQTGPLYASHGDGVQILLDTLKNFKLLMDDAQALHGQGNFTEARAKYLEAAEVLPDPLEQGRAIRGAAAGADHLGDTETAAKEAEQALDLHKRAVQLTVPLPDKARVPALRERCASDGMVGRIAVAAAMQQERSGKLTYDEAQIAAQKGLVHLDQALADIRCVERVTEVSPDQYKINILSRLAVAYSLYGDNDSGKAKGREYARQARLLGRSSEAPGNPTSAGLSRYYRLGALARSTARSYTAVAVNRLATREPSRRRNMALVLAGNRHLGL